MKFIKWGMTILLILAAAGWATCALYFGDSSTEKIQLILAATFAILSLLTLGSLAFTRWRKIFLAVYTTTFAGVLVWWLNIEPSNDRIWQADAEKLAYATIDGDKVTVHNIRNFDYQSEFDYRPGYYTKTFDLNKLEGVDLFSVYWMGPAIAHTIISFDFGGNDHLAFSIEARKEEGEGYSTIKGFFRQYELIYFVADERDVIRLRTNYRKNPPEQVYLYRLQGPLENARRLFRAYMNQINDLNEKPEFYNTLFDNCTTAIWFLTKINPEHLPFSWKIIVSGYLPDYLYDEKRLDNQLSFSELQKQAHINNLAQAADQAPDFSSRIRGMLNVPPE